MTQVMRSSYTDTSAASGAPGSRYGRVFEFQTQSHLKPAKIRVRRFLIRHFTADLYRSMGNHDQGQAMDDGAMAALMVISLGCMIGFAIGLLIGAALKKQKGEWPEMTRDEKTINIGLVAVCSLFCCAALAWYSLHSPLV